MDVLKIAVAVMNLYISADNAAAYPHCTYVENWDYPTSYILGVPAIRIKCDSDTRWIETDIVPVITPAGIFAVPLTSEGGKS